MYLKPSAARRSSSGQWRSCAQRYTYRYYGAQQGLTNLVIRCLLQDHEGYLWVGTDNGVFRYDGSTFRGFYRTDGLPSQIILNLAESPDGELWVTTDSGVARRRENRFVPVDVGGSTPSHYAGTGFDSSGRTYLLLSAGLARAEASRTDFRIVAPGAITGFYLKGDEVWFARDGELFRLARDRPEAVGQAAGLPRDAWTAITEDSAGTLWVRSATRLFSLLLGAKTFIDRSAGVAPSNAWMCRLRSTGVGVLIPTDTGLAVVGEPKAAPVIMDERHGLPAESVRDALMTGDGSLWVGTFGGGLARRLGRGDWVSWRREDGLPRNTVWAIHRDREGRLWTGSNGGLSRLDADGRVKRTWTMRDGLAGNRVEWIVDAPGGGVLVATQPFGVSRFGANGELAATYGPASGLKGTHSALLAVDRERRLWISTHNACYRSRDPADSGRALHFEAVLVPVLSREATFAGGVTVDSAGAVWLGTTEGLLRYSQDKWQLWSARDGLLANAVSAVSEQDGDYWLHYVDAMGLTRMRFRGSSLELQHFTTRNGLSSDAVFATALDRQRRLWVATDNGIDMLDGAHWRHFGVDDGLVSSDSNDGALYADGDAVWVGTSNGLSRYSNATSLAEVPVRPVLFSVDSEARTWRPAERPVLPYGQRWLRIRFGSLHFAEENAVRFRFRLAEEERSWKETRDRSVYYAGLPAGNHTFELEAAGQDGVWSRLPVRLTFQILTPWWQAWWFLVCCVLGGLLAVGTLWVFRVRMLLAQKAALEQQVAERTAELQLSYQKLEEIAFSDSLTSLANRRMFTLEFERRLADSARFVRFAFLLIDLDRFKPINDGFGHDAGDAVLAETAARLRAVMREEDCVARIGGDEFAILLTLTDEGPGVDEFCARLARAVSQPIRFKGHTLYIGMSAGAAVFPADGSTQEELYKAVDVALYQSKRRSDGPCWTHAGKPRLEPRQVVEV